MGLVQIYPAATIKEQGSKTLVGGASSLAVLSDVSDASYLRAAGSLSQNWSATFRMEALSLPAGAVVSRIQMRIKYSHYIYAPPNGSEIIQPVTILVGRANPSGVGYFGFTAGEIVRTYSTSTAIVQTWDGPNRSATFDGKAYLGTLLGRIGAGLYASVGVKRGVAWNTARLYSFSLLVHYNEPPTAPLIAPTGTQVVSRPTLEWDYSDVDGDPQAIYDARIYTDAQVSAAGFDADDPDRVPPVYWVSEWSAADKHVVEQPFGVNGDYWAALRATHANVGDITMWSDWSLMAFTLDVETPLAPTIAAAYDPDAHAVLVDVQGIDNLLSWGHSTFEVAPQPTLTAGTNTTLTRTTAQAAHGTWSYQLQRTVSTGTAAATVHAPLGATWGHPVEPGAAYTARASFRAATTGRSCRVSISFLDANGAPVGGGSGANVTDNSSGWVNTTAGPFTAPASALYAVVVCEALSAAAGESHYLDQVGLFPVATSAWNRGGWDDYRILLQRSLDGTTWEDIPETHATLGWDELTRTLTYADYEVPSGETVQYRARAEGDNQDGDLITGDWSSIASATMAAFEEWWIRDLASPGELSMPLTVTGVEENFPKPGTSDYPLDSDAAVVTHDGVKQPVLSVDAMLFSEAEYELFKAIVGTGRTLLLQDVLGRQWYVQPGDSISYRQVRAQPDATETTPVRHLHEVSLQFVSVEKPVRRVA